MAIVRACNYVVTRSYSSHPFLCALDTCNKNFLFIAWFGTLHCHTVVQQLRTINNIVIMSSYCKHLHVCRCVYSKEPIRRPGIYGLLSRLDMITTINPGSILHLQHSPGDWTNFSSQMTHFELIVDTFIHVCYWVNILLSERMLKWAFQYNYIHKC